MDSTDEEVSVGRSRGKEIALNVAAVAGLICIIATLASLIFGIKPLVFRSGSMEPAISTGALALAKTVPATELAVGDVISVDNDQGVRITHRVVELESAGADTVLATLKGDANNVLIDCPTPSPRPTECSSASVGSAMSLLGFPARSQPSSAVDW